MATAKKLLSLVGKSIKIAAFQALVKADRLKATKEEDLEEGQPIETTYVGKKLGYEILTFSGRVATLFLYAKSFDGFTAFPGIFPYGVESGATRAEVRKLLGKPERSGKAFKDPILGPQGAWDRFVIDSIRVHFEYTNPELQVKMVTLMTEEDSP